MEHHHFEEFLNVLDILEEKAASETALADVLHFKGEIYIYWLMFPQAKSCFRKEMEIWKKLKDSKRVKMAESGLKKAEKQFLE